MDDASHKPLVVKGVRQCGKTSSVMDFAQKHFKNVIYLDFHEHPEYKKFFTPNLEIDAIVMRITAAMPNVEIEAGKTTALGRGIICKALICLFDDFLLGSIQHRAIARRYTP